MNPFALTGESYVREINPLGQYRSQAIKLLQTMRPQMPKETIEKFVVDNIKAGKHGIRDPRIKYLMRQENGDRIMQEGTLMGYIKESLEKGEIIAPTLTTYMNQEVKESILVQFVEDNIKARGKAKKAMFVAKQKGDELLRSFKDKEQTGTKLSNNSLSGAHASPSTPLYNKTAHSSLTSNCRSTSGYGNANNEKFIAGNRHYWSPHIVVDNIVSIIDNTDEAEMEGIMSRYQLHYPTIEETIKVLHYSADVYWRNGRSWMKIQALVDKLSPLQRAAVVYTGDLFHLRMFNDTLVRDFITSLSTKVVSNETPPVSKEDKAALVAAIFKEPEDNRFLAAQICADQMIGHGKDYEALVEKRADIALTLLATARNVDQTLRLYADFIKAFFVTKNVPASVAYIRESIRHTAITSDTDSTIFTAQDWVLWHQHKLKVDQATVAVGASMIFLASISIVHILARMSANFGVNPKRTFQTVMKNEYYFPVFVPTNVSKHYFASRSCQEGDVLPVIEMEIKGVHLKSSNAPKEITKRAQAMMKEITEIAASGEKISLMKYLKEIADRQREIQKSIEEGNTKYYRLGEIKTAAAYKDPTKSQFVFWDMWNKAFDHKYATPLQLPYTTIKIATTLSTAMATKQWIASLEDKRMREGFQAWMEATSKANCPTIQIPLEAVRAYGIPQELIKFIDSRRIIADITQVFVLILETLGFYLPKGLMFFDLY